MNQVTKSLSSDEIARVEARKNTAQSEEQKAPPAVAKLVETGKTRTRTLTLEWPVEFDGTVYNELTFHRATGQDIRKIADLPGNNEAAELIALLTGVPVEVAEALDGDDFMEAKDISEVFLPRKLLAAAGQISASGTNTQP